MSERLELRAGTVREALKETVRRLKEIGLDTPVLDARLIVQHALGLDWDALFLGADRPLTAPERTVLADLLARRLEREPVSRIVGRRHFWTLDLAVSPATLDPRADSETVIEAALAALPDRTRPLKLLDLGTGTGALLLALLAEYQAADGVGVDRSAAAANVARDNAQRHGLGDRAAFLVGDWAGALAGRFDLIVSNPPYVARAELAALPPEVARHDPLTALDGGEDGLDAYRRILPSLPERLAADGVAILEIGAGQSAAVQALAAENGLVADTVRRDLGGRERALVLRLA